MVSDIALDDFRTIRRLTPSYLHPQLNAVHRGAVMYFRRFYAALGALCLASSATAASAAVNDYFFVAPNQSGTLLGAPYVNETVTYRVRADTATLTSHASVALFAAGKCVTGTTATVKVGAGAEIAITEPTLYCAGDAGGLAGIYFVGPDGPNHHTDSGLLDLSMSGTTITSANDHNLMTFYNVALVGGFFTTSTDGVSGNTSSASIVAVPAPVTVPTMTEWAMILFGLILAGGAAVMIHRRQFGSVSL